MRWWMVSASTTKLTTKDTKEHKGALRKTLRITPSSYFVSLVVDEFGTRYVFA